MKIRALCLTLFAFAAFAPTANGAVADHLLPIYDAADDVHVHVRAGGDSLRFGPKATKLHKTFAGRRAEVGCGEVHEDDDGRLMSSSFMANPGYRIAKRRGVVPMWTAGDYCAIATKMTKRDTRCLRTEDRKQCIRVIVASTAKGRAFLDQWSRSIELSLTATMVGMALSPELKVPGATVLERMHSLLGPDVVELTSPDASPPAGKVGYWTDANNVAAVVLLADGTRRFVRIQDGVFSTNDMRLNGLDDDDVFTLF